MPHALLGLLFTFASFAAPLPSLRIDPNGTTVSGISSGAFMAIQLQVALSAKVHGAASLAGGIYGCAEGSAAKAQLSCMVFPGALDAAKFVSLAKEEAAAGRIDALANLRNARFYLFHSEADATVHFPALAKEEAFLEAFTAKSNIKTVTVKDAAHAFPTADYGSACGTTGSPFIVNCGRDVAGEILTQLYPGLRAPANEASSSFVTFAQNEYASEGAGLADQAFLYVPKACEQGGCRLHIALHGCKMNGEAIKAEFREHGGYNRWADTNRIVVLYPETTNSFLNPNGCWDWFGYTGGDYAVKSGKQIEFFEKVIDTLRK